jgi:hypothetical protein
MEKSKEILKAKESGNKQKVQKLQQDFKEKDNSFTALTDMESTDLYNNIMERIDNEVIYDDIKQEIRDMPQKTTTIEDIVEYIKENYPETEEMFKKELNNMYLTFCSKQFDYGPNNIAMGTLLSNEKEISMSLLGIIVRLNDKVNRMVNLATKHDFKAQNEPIEDAFLDVAIYCVMALIVKSGKWSK